MKTLFQLFILSILLSLFSCAKYISEPTLGYVEHREAIVIVEGVKYSTQGKILYRTVSNGKKGKIKTISINKTKNQGNEENVFRFKLENLSPGTDYQYSLKLGKGNKTGSKFYSFKTREIWEYRKPAPNFSFLFGSCAYLNDSAFDRPGKPYGASTDIFKTMLKDSANFNIWTGDNFYYRDADCSSPSGIRSRVKRDRKLINETKILNIRPNYAIWDDHDYGPNDANSSFKFKKLTNQLFQEYWGNPVYGNSKGEGIYGNFTFSDCEFFLMDDRFFRTQEKYPDSINGLPNPEKTYWGRDQMEWLKNALLTSNATFKIILNGNQMLNKNIEVGECLSHYTYETKEFTNFLANQSIKGVILISGDRHFSEVLKVPVPNMKYPVYEITCSPLTSGAFKDLLKTKEGINPLRLDNSLIMNQNYGKISVSGAKGDRTLHLEMKDSQGKVLYSLPIKEAELK